MGWLYNPSQLFAIAAACLPAPDGRGAAGRTHGSVSMQRPPAAAMGQLQAVVLIASGVAINALQAAASCNAATCDGTLSLKC